MATYYRDFWVDQPPSGQPWTILNTSRQATIGTQTTLSITFCSFQAETASNISCGNNMVFRSFPFGRTSSRLRNVSIVDLGGSDGIMTNGIQYGTAIEGHLVHNGVTNITEHTWTEPEYQSSGDYYNDTYHWYTFDNEQYVDSVVIPSFVKHVGSRLFYTSLYNYIKKIIVECATSIGDYAFGRNGNGDIDEIEIADTVTTLGDYVFADNENLQSIDFNGATISSIGAYCFSNCQIITDTNIDRINCEIKSGTFNNCYALVNFSNDNYILGCDPNGTRHFYNCNSLKEFSIGSGNFPTSYNSVFYVDRWAGSDLDQDGYFITTIHTENQDVIDFNFKQWNNRVVTFDSGADLLCVLDENGNWIIVKGFDNGDIAVKCEDGTWKYAKLTSNLNDPAALPLILNIAGSWMKFIN